MVGVSQVIMLSQYNHKDDKGPRHLTAKLSSWSTQCGLSDLVCVTRVQGQDIESKQRTINSLRPKIVFVLFRSICIALTAAGLPVFAQGLSARHGLAGRPNLLMMNFV